MEKVTFEIIKSFIINKKFENFTFSMDTRNPSFDDISFLCFKMRYEDNLVGEIGLRVIRVQGADGGENVINWEKRAVMDWVNVPSGLEKLGIEAKMFFELEKVLKLYNVKSVMVRVSQDSVIKKKGNDIVLDKKSMKKLGYELFSKEKDSSLYVLNVG